MKDTINQIYTAMHGKGFVTFDRCLMLIVYYIRVVTVEQICRLDDYKKEYAYQRLKILCDKGYLMKHRQVIPAMLVHTPHGDTYTITKRGESFVRCYLLEKERLRITSRDEEGLYFDHSQTIHSIGLANFFYALLPYWDNTSEWYTEDYIRGAGLRPDARYLRRSKENCASLTLYIEEDTGTQNSSDSLQDKFRAYSSYLNAFQEEQYTEIPESVLLFHISDMRALACTMPQPVSFTNRVAAADRKLAAEQGEDYRMRLEDFNLSGCRTLLPAAEQKAEYLTRDQIKYIKKNLRKKEHEELEKRKRRYRMEYVRKRMYALNQCDGLEEWWVKGFRTIGIPGSYDKEYLPLLFPHLFFPDFKRYLDLIDYGQGIYDYSMLQKPEYVLYPLSVIKGKFTLVIENISNDLSGRFRAARAIQSGICDILMLAESLADVQALLKEHPAAGGHLYFILYEDVWSGTVRVRDYVSQAEIHVIEEE